MTRDELVTAQSALVEENERLRAERLKLARLADYAILIAEPRMIKSPGLSEALALRDRVLAEAP